MQVFFWREFNGAETALREIYLFKERCNCFGCRGRFASNERADMLKWKMVLCVTEGETCSLSSKRSNGVMLATSVT